MSKPFKVTIEDDRNPPRVVVTGELDLASSEELEEMLAQVEASEPATLVLDLRELEFMDSTGLRMVALAERSRGAAGRPLVLVRGPDAIHRVFAITRMDEHLSFVDDPGSLTGDETAA